MTFINRQALINGCTGTDFLVLELIQFLGGLQSKRSPSGAHYVVASQLWIARKLGVRRETVNRSVRHLLALGLLTVKHRRKVQGHWQTNVTMLRSWVGKAYAKVVKFARSHVSHVRKKSHIAPPKGEAISPPLPFEGTPPPVSDETKVSFQDFIKSLEAKKSPHSFNRS